MTSNNPINLAVVGIGGYAKRISDLILEDGQKTPGKPQAILTACCDPDIETHTKRAIELREAGVEVFDDYDKMLESDIDAVWLPVPTPLHLSFTQKALRAGKPVMVEKPAAGCLDDVDQMILARDKAKLPVLVGFQDVYDKTTLPLKRRILNGEFGKVNRATLHACWPRSDKYFNRANWAGKQKINDTWVLDSPANNALAHFINIALFLLGPDEKTSAAPTKVQAELYRAGIIENYDTISLKVKLSTGPELLILLTHASGKTVQPEFVIHSEKAKITREISQIAIQKDSDNNIIPRDSSMRNFMLEQFVNHIQGKINKEIGTATLEVARTHSLLVSGISQFTPIYDVPEKSIETATIKDGGTVRAIPNIHKVFDKCIRTNSMLHESNLLPFTKPASEFDLTEYKHFEGVKKIYR